MTIESIPGRVLVASLVATLAELITVTYMYIDLSNLIGIHLKLSSLEDSVSFPICSVVSSSFRREISENAVLSFSRSVSILSARVFICTNYQSIISDLLMYELTADMVSLAAMSS